MMVPATSMDGPIPQRMMRHENIKWVKTMKIRFNHSKLFDQYSTPPFKVPYLPHPQLMFV